MVKWTSILPKAWTDILFWKECFHNLGCDVRRSWELALTKKGRQIGRAMLAPLLPPFSHKR